jgi:hypothetical protein
MRVLRPADPERLAWLRPADPERLAWLRPEGVPAAEFAAARERLAAWLARGGATPVYEAKRRALYRVDDPVLGPVAVKEIRSGGLARELYFRRFAAHPALRELRAGAGFAARGGATPPWLAAALERDALRLRRVLLCLRWVDGTRSLGAFLSGLGREPDAALLGTIADRLLAAARLGLVHGRHSGDNLLVTGRAGGLEIWVIDFAHAELGPGFDAEGFARDAGRIAAGLVILGHASAATAARLLDAAAAAWPDPASAPRARARLAAAYERSLAAGPPSP